jgi:hypothetical protein
MSEWADKVRKSKDRVVRVGYQRLKAKRQPQPQPENNKDPGRRAVRKADGTWGEDEIEA